MTLRQRADNHPRGPGGWNFSYAIVDGRCTAETA